MTPNRDGKAVVPGRGGYDIEFVEVTGPPDSMMPMPPAKSRGKLTPLGTGEGVPEGVPQRAGPGEFLRKRVPLALTLKEIESLPRWARVAFGARCARRVLPAVTHFWKNAPEHHLQALDRAVSVAEHAVDARAVDARAVDAASDAASDAADTTHTAFDAARVARAARAAVDAAFDTAFDAALTAYAARNAARVLFETATIDTPLTAQLRCIRRDFARLKRFAREQKWTDDTPVPPDVFGPMWPDGVEPYWAVEPPPTSAPPAGA